MNKFSPNALTDRRSEKSVLHPQVQSGSCRTETKRLGRSGANGAQVGESLSNDHLLICPACGSREVIRLSSDQAQCGPCGEIFFLATLEDAA